MIKAYKYRLKPTFKQREYLEECFNANRFIWNRVHETYEFMYQNNWFAPSNKFEKYNERVNWINRQVTQMVNDPDFSFLKKIPKRALVTTVRDYFDAWKRFFKIKDVGKPRFKNRYSKQSFRSDYTIKFDKINYRLNIRNHSIKVFKDKRVIDGIIKTITISKTKSGKYFMSMVVHDDKKIPDKVQINKTIGIDFGVKTFITTSEDLEFKNLRLHQKYKSRKRRLQKKLQRQRNNFVKDENGRKIKSKRYLTTLKKYNILLEKIKNQKLHYIHNITKKITDEYDGISIEDLSISNMTRKAKSKKDENGNYKRVNRKQKSGLNREILDVSIYETTRQLEYKSEYKGKTLKKVDRFFASSKTCNKCKHVNKDLKLSDRVFKCEKCGNTIDRDKNAALNIEEYSFK